MVSNASLDVTLHGLALGSRAPWFILHRAAQAPTRGDRLGSNVGR